MTMNEAIEAFREQLETAGFSPRTVDAYSRLAAEFASFLGRYHPRVTTPMEITREIVGDYQQYVREQTTRTGRPLANTTVRLKLTAVKQLFAYLVSVDQVLKDPTTVIVAPKEEQRLIRNVLSQTEVADILKKLEPRDAVSTRDRAILELFYACGMRTSELCDLAIADVDLAEQTVTIVRGKGGKSRVLPIGQYAAHYVGLYLDRARPHLLRGRKTDPGNLFLSSRGTPFNRQTINRSVMGHVNRIADSERRITAYSIRHSVATHLIANNVDVTYVARLLGHASLETTRRYLRIEIGDLKAMHTKYHPREQE